MDVILIYSDLLRRFLLNLDAKSVLLIGIMLQSLKTSVATLKAMSNKTSSDDYFAPIFHSNEFSHVTITVALTSQGYFCTFAA